MTSGATTISTIVNDFLTVPGIAGFAVMDNRSPIYFCDLDGTLKPQDENRLAQSLTQILGSIPLEFNQIELRQRSYQTHLYRIDYATLFMVLAHPSLETDRYHRILPIFLETLRHSRGDLLQEVQASQPPTIAEAAIAPAPAPLSAHIDTIALETLLETLTVDPTPSMQAMLEAFNRLANLAVGYLGKIIITNQIKTTKPADEWFTQFTVDAQAQLMINPVHWNGQTTLLPEQHRLFQEWAYQLIRATARVIRTFQEDVETGLSEADQALLLDPAKRRE
jgi:hypothetical protein